MAQITDSMVEIPSLSKTLKQAVEDGDLSGGSIEDALKTFAIKNWRVNSTANDTNCTWIAAAWNGTNMVIAVNFSTGSGNPRTMYSNNGIGWVAGATHATERCTDIAYGGGVWVRTGRDSTTSAPIIHSSSNGLTWTSRTSPTTIANGAWLVAHNGTYFCISYQTITGSAGSKIAKLARSTDGTTWTAKEFSAYDSDVIYTDMAAGNGIFCIAGGAFGFYMSSDADSWAHMMNGAGDFVEATYDKVEYGDTKFVAFNTIGGSFENRIAWKNANLTIEPFTVVPGSSWPDETFEWNFYNHVYAHGMWIFLAEEGLMYTKDLVNFTAVGGVIPEGSWFDAILVDNKIIVTGGSNAINTGRAMSSLDFAELT